LHASLDDSQLDAFAANGLLIIDNFLEEHLILQILAEAKHWQVQEAFIQAGIGKLDKHLIQENYRSDKIKWINSEACLPATKAYLGILETLMQQISREFFLSLKDYECMYAIYPKGSFYKKHKDRFEQEGHRIISVVLYMNENWTEEFGGQLIIDIEEGNQIVNPIFNRLVFFKSELWHEVVPCHSERFSITGWMKDQLNDVNFL
jgi:SM-20-related protein